MVGCEPAPDPEARQASECREHNRAEHDRNHRQDHQKFHQDSLQVPPTRPEATRSVEGGGGRARARGGEPGPDSSAGPEHPVGRSVFHGVSPVLGFE